MTETTISEETKYRNYIDDRLLDLAIEFGIDLVEVAKEYTRRENRLVLAYNGTVQYKKLQENALIGTEQHYQKMYEGK